MLKHVLASSLAFCSLAQAEDVIYVYTDTGNTYYSCNAFVYTSTANSDVIGQNCSVLLTDYLLWGFDVKTNKDANVTLSVGCPSKLPCVIEYNNCRYRSSAYGDLGGVNGHTSTIIDCRNY